MEIAIHSSYPTGWGHWELISYLAQFCFPSLTLISGGYISCSVRNAVLKFFHIPVISFEEDQLIIMSRGSTGPLSMQPAERKGKGRMVNPSQISVQSWILQPRHIIIYLKIYNFLWFAFNYKSDIYKSTLSDICATPTTTKEDPIKTNNLILASKIVYEMWHESESIKRSESFHLFYIYIRHCIMVNSTLSECTQWR